MEFHIFLSEREMESVFTVLANEKYREHAAVGALRLEFSFLPLAALQLPAGFVAGWLTAAYYLPCFDMVHSHSRHAEKGAKPVV